MAQGRHGEDQPQATFRYAKRFAKGRYSFRAITAKDADHLAGRSPVRKVRVR